MPLRMWTYDIAREQCPTPEFLNRLCRLSLDSGYNAIGLYVEHRFAFQCAPWAHGKDLLTPEMVKTLEKEFPELQIVPFINVLSHMEGFIHTERGKKFAEEPFKGMQACPSDEGFISFAQEMVDETIQAFKSELIHIGGDEAGQLGRCPRCAARVKGFEKKSGADGKAHLYGEHFGPLSERVLKAGRTPGVWGDMLLDHPQALDYMPKGTVIFDWQYFSQPHRASELSDRFQVVCCPTLHTYNALWMHLPQSEFNVRQNIAYAQQHNMGVCLATWECELLGNYETILPAIKATGQLMNKSIADTGLDVNLAKTHPKREDLDSWSAEFMEAYTSESPSHAEWAKLMGSDLQELGDLFLFGDIRNSIKCRLLLYGNPFLAWLHHGKALSGDLAKKALHLADQAIACAPNASYRGPAVFLQKAVEFVVHAEQARQAYAQELPGVAASSLAPCRQIFDDLEKVARASHINACGSLADIERCRTAKGHVELVIRRLKEYGDGSLGYLPSFEMITHPKFMPYDQGEWWIINSWANQ